MISSNSNFFITCRKKLLRALSSKDSTALQAICITTNNNWGEPERAPYWSKTSPALSIYVCMRTSFRKCPRVVIHRMVSILLN